MIWRKKLKINIKQWKINIKLYVKECYVIAWSVGKIQKVKTKKVVKAKNGRRILLSIVLCVIVKSWNLLKSTKLENY